MLYTFTNAEPFDRYRYVSNTFHICALGLLIRRSLAKHYVGMLQYYISHNAGDSIDTFWNHTRFSSHELGVSYLRDPYYVIYISIHPMIIVHKYIYDDKDATTSPGSAIMNDYPPKSA